MMRWVVEEDLLGVYIDDEETGMGRGMGPSRSLPAIVQAHRIVGIIASRQLRLVREAWSHPVLAGHSLRFHRNVGIVNGQLWPVRYVDDDK